MTAPIDPKKRLEKSIEAAVLRWADARGIRNRKMNGMGSRHWPDRMFLIPAHVSKSGSAMSVFIEFKRLGAVPTPGQEKQLQDLRDDGFNAECCDTVEGAKALLASFIK